MRSEAEIRLNSQSRARSLSTPKKLPIENLLKNFEEVDKEENQVVEMEKPEIPIGRPLIVYDNSSGKYMFRLLVFFSTLNVVRTSRKYDKTRSFMYFFIC